MKIFYFIKNNIPNTLTLLNLMCGSFSIVAITEGYPLWASFFIFIAAFFDFFDGMVARLLKATSNIGKELDSLADLISFGLAPSFIVFSLLKSVLLIDNISPENINHINIVKLALPFFIAVFSGIRLANFNIDTRQTTEFIGLPTPANAIFIAWLPIILSNYELNSMFLILNEKTLLTISIVNSLLLVSPFPFFSFKLKEYNIKNYYLQLSFLILCLILVALFNIYSVIFIFILYVLIAFIRYILSLFLKN